MPVNIFPFFGPHHTDRAVLVKHNNMIVDAMRLPVQTISKTPSRKCLYQRIADTDVVQQCWQEIILAHQIIVCGSLNDASGVRHNKGDLDGLKVGQYV